MMQPNEARELCSKSEWALVEKSFPAQLKTLTPSELTARIDRVEKLQRKCLDLLPQLHSDSRIQTVRRKAELFGETLIRFRAGAGAARGVEPATSKIPDESKTPEEMQPFGKNDLRDRASQGFVSRKTHAPSKAASRGKQQQAGGSGEKRIQSHVSSAVRRQQGRRDSKNR